MNVVARVHLYPPHHNAGAEMMLHELLKALVARGHRVQVHLSRHKHARAPYTLDGVEVFPRDSADWQAEAQKADVLVTHLDNTSTMISASIAYDKPLVQVLHNTHAPTRMWASCRNDLLVYNSDWMATELGDHPNGIVVRPPVYVRDYEVDNDFATAVTLINLTQIKGGLVFAMLAAMMPGVTFLGVEGAYGEQLIPPYMGNTEIRSHGTNMLNVYRDTRLLIMPSHYESWGRTGVEAMCSGIPVVATDTPGLRESLGDAGTFLHRDASIYEWCDTIWRLLEDETAYGELSAKARSRALAHDLMATAEVNTFVHRVEALTS